MTSWGERFDEHSLWVKVGEMQESLKGLELETDEPDARDSREYLEHVAALVGARRATTDSVQVTTAMLDATAAAVDNAHAYMQQSWTPGSNDASMDTQVEGIVQALASWPALTTEELAQAHSIAANRIQEDAEKALHALRERRDEVLATLDELKAKEAALAEKVTEQTQVISAATAEFSASSKQAIADSKKEWIAERDKQAESAAKNLETLKDLEQEARDLVHAATASVVATDYGEYARKETRAGWICDVSAALVGAIGVAAILYHLFTATEGADSNIGLSLTRLAASIGALGVAALVGKRGNQHHREARAAKRTDLAIRQVGPFVANLAKDERELVVAEVTDRIFIKGELDTTTPRGDLVDRVRQLRRERSESGEDV